MGRYTGKTCRLIFMLVLTLLFFIAEIVAGYMGNSIALVSDSFNMLSDILSLCVGLTAGRLSRRPGSGRSTYGLARAEVVGALANAVFLAALCFSISVESVKRLIDPQSIHDPLLVLVVGALGLAVNVVGLFIFQDYSKLCRCFKRSASSTGDGKISINGEAGPPALQNAKEQENNSKSDGQPLNIRGVLLHVLNDALGSVVVVIAATIFYKMPLNETTPCNWQCYVDPVLTLLMVAIIMSSAVPLVKETSSILLQMAPSDLAIKPLVENVCRLPGVLSTHEVHVWELAKDRNVATLHIKVSTDHYSLPSSSSSSSSPSSLAGVTTLHARIREVFHAAGIHSVTAQLEFCSGDMEGSACATPCANSDCVKSSCCPVAPKAELNHKEYKAPASRDIRVDIGDASKDLLKNTETKEIESTGF